MTGEGAAGHRNGAPSDSASTRRRKLRRWLGWGIPILLLAWVAVLGVSAFIAYSALRDVVPVAGDVQEQIASGDSAGAQASVDEAADKTRTARMATGHVLWRGVEWLPFIGDDVQSVRLATAAADDLVRDALKPFAGVEIKALGPTDGAINLDVVRSMAEPVSQAAIATEEVQIDLSAIDTSTLVAPVGDAVGQLTGTVSDLWPSLVRLDELMPHLPSMLGADGPRNYITIVQNNAEARTTGGNPASIMMLTADQGRIAITKQAASTDFNNARETPIIPLDEGTETLYGDRVGRWIQDSTMTPKFSETANLVRAFWQETYGDPGAGVLSLDPVALGYMLEATGGVGLPSGQELNSSNAVDLLLNGVYFKYPGDTESEKKAQDAFFAAAAGGVFEKITGGSADIVKLAQAIGKASGEGRILFSSTDPIEARAVEGTSLAGPLPEDNQKETALGVFVNDTTEGKLDYYADMSVSATSNACQADEAPTFTTEATYNYTLDPADVATLPYYISTANHFAKGNKATDMVFYGPVGGTYVSAEVDGEAEQPDVGTTDEGRPAVRIRVFNEPSTSHTFKVTFAGVAGEEYGPLDVVHTPLVKKVPTEVTQPDCG
ncbi:DUF4012 domain-containing protein [Microbacterium oryzae]|uniref:DUF4012 domain-containing protein n=1 Tax=Microbacterium oryzae TaxID=743009 RepID=A0A6I6E0U5_9MICO|nr:DUF4012 domain-containing protein [Microbacterium oryzae]QGU27559.1 DUF4012 domain-containing protein [Microbacterium oryzae]